MAVSSGDTIYALASGAVPAGVAVIRVSGPDVRIRLPKLVGTLPPPRSATLRNLCDGADALIDRGLVLWFPQPTSFTGEDVVELHLHGGRAVLAAAMEALGSLGFRLAKPGEFSRRAFLNGKLDLTQAEGLADLVASETDAQRRQALMQAGGALAAKAAEWRETLLHLRAEVEARLDFADEGDVPEGMPASYRSDLETLLGGLNEAVAGAIAGERTREGYRVVLAGPPNAGKSSLLNAIVGRAAAIVDDEAGTTRDVVEVAVDLGGYAVRFFDTAGLRESESRVEQEGVRRARLLIDDADLVLWLQDVNDRAAEVGCPPPAKAWRVGTKSDLSPLKGDLAVSTVTGYGLSELKRRIAAEAARGTGGGASLVTRARQRQAVEQARDVVQLALCASDEIAADLLRSAGEAIGRLSGRIDIEEVLDRVFADFCIGK